MEGMRGSGACSAGIRSFHSVMYGRFTVFLQAVARPSLFSTAPEYVQLGGLLKAAITSPVYNSRGKIMTGNSATPNIPTVLVLGSTGQVGGLIVKDFEAQLGRVNLRVTSRRQAEVDKLRAEGKDAVLLDLDDPRTFGPALHGVDRLFLLNGYSVEMLVHSKTLIDAAKKAGVEHIVHLGTYGEWDTTDPHFAWHQLVERYIEASGISWTHLHPNMFMENLVTFMAPSNGLVTSYWGEARMGWIALADVAAVAATVLSEGPIKHHGKDYWLSTDVLTPEQTAAALSKVTGQTIKAEIKLPDDFKALIDAGLIPMEKWYAAGAVEFLYQVYDGRMGYIGTARNDLPYVTGKTPTSLEQWAQDNLSRLQACLDA
jgi:NAD(P)H dehydrogenase (quinone)